MQSVEAACTSAGLEIEQLMSRHRQALVDRDGPRRNAQPVALPTRLFQDLVAALPESQREVLTMLKVNELSLEAVARFDSRRSQTKGPSSLSEVA
jgi:hypothetical protein